MSDRACAPSTVRTAVVWDALRRVLADRAAVTGRGALDVLDAGGGTGGFAVPLAELGHGVTVIDPTPDSLAALERRAGEAGVTARVRAVQGDTDDLQRLVDTASADLVLCHSVLEFVDDPLAALAAIGRTLRAGGAVSVLAANRAGAAVHRALSGGPGGFAEARQVLRDPDGRWGGADSTPHRFTVPELTGLLTEIGLAAGQVHGVRVFADLVPNGFVDGDSGARDLLELEAAAAECPDLWGVATQLHLLGHAPH